MPKKHLAYHTLSDQMAHPGCAICLLGARAAVRYLEGVSGEFLTDPAVRDRLRASRGFCDPHAHELDALAPRLSVAILYDDFLRDAATALERRLATRRREALPRCPACETVQREETDFVREMAAFIDDPEMAAAFEASSGLCLRHTAQLCRLLKEPARRWVLGVERARIERLRAELAEVIRKHDYRFQREPWGEERSAPTRAVAKAAGERAGVERGRREE